MHILLAGDSLQLQQVLDAIQGEATEPLHISHAHSEGELFLLLRQDHPDLVIFDQTIYAPVSSTWFEYLSLLSPQSRMLFVEPDSLGQKKTNE